MMNTYWVDFNGWFQVQAETPEEANDKAVCEISNRMGNLENFHFEIDGSELDEDA